MQNRTNILLLFIVISSFCACNSHSNTDKVKQTLIGQWVEDLKGHRNSLPDSVSFIDYSTFALRTKQMESVRAYKYDIDENYIVLFYQNSQLNWVEASRHTFSIENERLIIEALNGEPNNEITFRKITH